MLTVPGRCTSWGDLSDSGDFVRVVWTDFENTEHGIVITQAEAAQLIVGLARALDRTN